MMEFARHPSKPGFDGDTCVSAVDWLGNRFCVGDTVIYCVGAGRGQMMAIGVVQKMRSKPRVSPAGRRAEPGETPTRYLDWHEPPMPWIHYEHHWDEVEVQVLTAGTSGAYDNAKRGRPAWVNAMNITALHGLEAAAKARVSQPAD